MLAIQCHSTPCGRACVNYHQVESAASLKCEVWVRLSTADQHAVQYLFSRNYREGIRRHLRALNCELTARSALLLLFQQGLLRAQMVLIKNIVCSRHVLLSVTAPSGWIRAQLPSAAIWRRLWEEHSA